VPTTLGKRSFELAFTATKSPEENAQEKIEVPQQKRRIVLNFSKTAAPQATDEREFSDDDDPSESEAEEREDEDMLSSLTPPSSDE